MSWLFAATLLTILAVLGPDRLARPLTDDEKKRFGALLREHDYPGARLVALRFAYRLTHNRTRAQDLMGRVDLRLVRLGWDPSEVSLVKRLCRLVWSEWTHATAETKATRRVEEGFLRGLEATEGVSVQSVEQRTAERQSRETAAADAQLDKLRASFEQARDEVNLLWLKWALEGETDVQKMAAASGRDVAEFYAAAKRRKRAVRRLLAEAHGLKYEEEQS